MASGASVVFEICSLFDAMQPVATRSTAARRCCGELPHGSHVPTDTSRLR